ncbi:TomO hydrophobic C-terminal domain-containing protein [Wolbachia endosymbiont (group A) of Epistrophe grossularia]|uniref:TomO hydrophobic C-terminal domain-containing protein n=1 Tax=Wolbachia endosymbiont (group A) of Epistrophe grossularia TaxID=2954008 RepID=UPI00222F9C3F|nr:hypothetical protein [Wolbachia endosymbiont (group A) of Epistrophe grossularia]
MDFKQYVKGDTLLLSSDAINISDLVSFLERNQSITRLILRFSKIGNEGAKILASGNLPNLTSLHLFCNNISAEGAEALAKGNLLNLASLHLLFNKIGDEGVKALANGNLTKLTSLRLVANKIGNEGAKALANSNLPNLKLLYLGNHLDTKSVKALLATKNVRNLLSPDLVNNIGDKGAEALAKGNLLNLASLELSNNNISAEGAEALAKDNLPNLTSLGLSCNNIGNKGAEALANVNLTKFTKLDLFGNNIDFEHIEVLARSQCSGIKLGDRDQKVFYDFLLKKCSNNQVVDEESIKRMIFIVARSNHSGDLVRYILTQPDKYPFLINSKDEQGHTLSHFYNHSPEIQEFLFKHGLVPEKDSTLRNITNDKQSVHAGLAVKKTKFITKNLVESIKASEGQLEQAVNSYVESIGLLKQYQNDPIRLRLLSLTNNEKKSAMEKTLRETDPTPGDEKFIEAVIDKAEQALKQQYLKKNFRGEYDQGYPTNRMQYDYTRGSERFITIPESIGYIKLLIDDFSVPLKEKKELLVTLMEQNPDLVKNKLSKVKEKLGNSVILDKEQFNKTELHGLLDGIDDGKKVDELFKEISCLNIEEVWREQKEFILLKQIYIAATTYGENSSACIQGTWSQIIGSINEISSEVVAQYDRYLEEEQRREMQKDAITEENIKPFLEGLANKLIQHVELNPELKETLEDFVVCTVDIDKPEEITFEQQKILAEINKCFSENINDILQNYNRNIPSRGEYGLVIEGLSEVKVMQRFVQPGQEPFNLQENITGENVPSIPGKLQPSKPSEKRSKLPIVTASALAIAGVVSGIAIAVYLEMLAVGIAVGACCLVAAAIIYYCNRPSSSLGNSNVQGSCKEVQEPHSEGKKK